MLFKSRNRLIKLRPHAIQIGKWAIQIGKSYSNWDDKLIKLNNHIQIVKWAIQTESPNKCTVYPS